jgi:predicted transcriptional regulator
MEEVKRGRGRPTVGERVPLGLRVTPELKQRLDAAAELSGRSQSQEAEFRIEHSFDRQDLLPDVLSIAYGSKEIADLLMTLGTVFRVAGEAVATTSKMRERLKSRDWTSDPAVCDIAIEAAHTVLESFRPIGSIPWIDAGLGVRVANNLFKEKMREVSQATLSARLQKIAERLSIKSSAPQKKVGDGLKHQAPFATDVVDLVEMRRRRA